MTQEPPTALPTDLRVKLAYALSNIRRDLDAIDGLPFGSVNKRLDRIAEQVAAAERLLERPLPAPPAGGSA